MQTTTTTLLQQLNSFKEQRKKALAVLIDPDKVDEYSLSKLLALCNTYPIDFFLVGGSLITTPSIQSVISQIKSQTSKPVILFPGNSLHIEPSADAILFLSLLSGRNPEFLIGQHVVAAPLLKQSQLEVLSTGYLLIESGRPTTVSYMSNTTPIPNNKPDIAACTALAGQYLGMKLIYLDAGSGAEIPVPAKLIKTVRGMIDIPLIVGGGLNTPEKVAQALEAGADIITIGNAFEDKPEFLEEVAKVFEKYNQASI